MPRRTEATYALERMGVATMPGAPKHTKTKNASTMTWNDHLQKAKLDLKASRLDDCLAHLNRAILAGGDREHTVYDCRAAVYERQGKLKSALKDVHNVIKLVPAHWQGYARASRLFLRAGKLDEAEKMADLALGRLDAADSMRRTKLEEVKADVRARRRASIHHFGQLPVEIITAIFEMVCSSDWTRVLTLWRVSKHWHNIALNTPNLWSTLVLTNRHPARHAQRWIERSKGRIRQLSFRSSLPSTVSLDGLVWGCVRSCKLDHYDSAQYLWEKHDRLPGLEELQVTLPALDCDALLVHPGLQRLLLDGSQFSWDKLASNHGSLTSLEIRNPCTPPNFEQVALVLESNPMLEQLILELESSVLLPSPTPLTLSNLHTLPPR
ncbi:hypothetical protein FB45DRAFT_1021004 [Roridomyces roridus]|uniref:F-box domain-containing protein n=1 Tax=Roridomyces roridus TaxID=1738132 RepID=A0AAD7FUT5_9AGAR|nr:hypothetical protein FB45DRAFT_1021004 [Roridomyces roridus]